MITVFSLVRISGGREELVADTGDLVLVGSGHTVGEYQVHYTGLLLVILPKYRPLIGPD